MSNYLDSYSESASDALREIIFGAWSDDERIHLARLEERLAQLKAQG